MILVVDSSALALLVNPAANPPNDPETGQPVAHVRERLEFLISGITPSDTLIIPTPVLAEALVRAEEGGPGLLEALGGLAKVKVRPFGERAAIETAMMTREALLAGDKRGGSEAPWQKVKVDRQVIAIARVEGATRIYADDRKLVAFAKRLGLDAFSTWDLPLPTQEINLFTAAGVAIDLPSGEDEQPSSSDSPSGKVATEVTISSLSHRPRAINLGGGQGIEVITDADEHMVEELNGPDATPISGSPVEEDSAPVHGKGAPGDSPEAV